MPRSLPGWGWGRGVPALLAELSFLLILGNVGASPWRECGIWLSVSADSQHFLGLKPGQVLCVAQRILLPVQLSDPPGGGVSKVSFLRPRHQGRMADWLRPNQGSVAAGPARVNLLRGANTMKKPIS